MIDEVLERPNHESIDGTYTGGDAFFRSTDRSSPHNAYANGPGIKQAVIDKGMSLEDRGLTDSYHYKFTAKDKPNTLEQYETGARNATKIDMTGAYPLTRCYFEYNENDGLYFQNEWQHLSKEVNVPAGLYKLAVAWFNDDNAEYGEDAPGAIDNISIREKGAPTSISNTGFGTDGKAIKFIRDEKVFILVNGVIYDATGRKVEVVK